MYSFARILITLHRPVASGFDEYLKTQASLKCLMRASITNVLQGTLSEAASTICGIALELKDEGSQILSAQCLFGAGLCVQDEDKRNAILSLIDSCEARTGWPMVTLRTDLMAEWSRVP